MTDLFFDVVRSVLSDPAHVYRWLYDIGIVALTTVIVLRLGPVGLWTLVFLAPVLATILAVVVVSVIYFGGLALATAAWLGERLDARRAS